jgi:hypothetical protein
MTAQNIDVPVTEIPAVKSYASASRLVSSRLLRLGIEHDGIRDRCIDAVARAVRMHGHSEAARLVPTICAEVTRELS